MGGVHFNPVKPANPYVGHVMYTYKYVSEVDYFFFIDYFNL